jgi:hypothetical protein
MNKSVMNILCISIDELFKKLEEFSKRSGKSTTEFVTLLLQKELGTESPMLKVIEELRAGRKPGRKINLARLLKDSEPYFNIVEDAIRYSREYP